MEMTHQHYKQQQQQQQQQQLITAIVTIITATHFKGDTGLLVEVDLSDDSSSFLFHIKDAPTVRRPVQVHSVADKTGRSALEEGERGT